jgi:hypothetical protein
VPERLPGLWSAVPPDRAVFKPRARLWIKYLSAEEACLTCQLPAGPLSCIPSHQPPDPSSQQLAAAAAGAGGGERRRRRGTRGGSRGSDLIGFSITTHCHPLPRITTHYHALPTHYHPLPTHYHPLATYPPITTHCPPITTHYLPTHYHEIGGHGTRRG